MARSKRTSQQKAEKYPNGREYYHVAPITPSQTEYYELMKAYDITICKANAGSGKTLLALNLAISMLRHDHIKEIIYLRNPVTFKKYGSEGIGYLKGDLEDKMLPLLQPIEDNLSLLIPEKNKREQMIRIGQISALPIEYCQGRSFRDAFIIVDEAQNIAPDLIHLILTRISDRSKMVILGGCKKATQSKVKDGLADALFRFRHSENIATFEFDNEDVVPRHPLIKEINVAYDR